MKIVFLIFAYLYLFSNKIWFWSIKNSGEVLSKLKSRGFRATSLSTYDFSTLYTTFPHNPIKEKLMDLIEWTFKRALKNYGSLYLARNDRKAFFTSSEQSRYTLWSCQNVCDAFPISWMIFILDLGPSYTDKLLEFRWVEIGHLS